MLKKYGTIMVFFCFIVLGSMCLTSCGNNSNGDVEILSENSSMPEVTSDTDLEEPLVSGTLTSLPNDEDSLAEDEIDEDAEDSYKDALANTKTLSIYSINDDGTDIESVDTYIDTNAGVSSQLVVDQVVDELSNRKITVDVDSVIQDDDGNVYVSFTGDSAPVEDVGEDVETIILDCISQSILDNVEASEAVIFQIEGNAYKSKNLAFGIDEAYDWK